jgi:DUF1680 family protein
VYVILYIPSTVTWVQNGAVLALKETGTYPLDHVVEFAIATSKTSEFALNLRIPQWTKGATISVNGKRIAETPVTGTFASLQRSWKNGDRVTLELPLAMGLEPIDAQHPNTVAVVQGPLVLFPIGDVPADTTGAQLLAAKKVAAERWRATTSSGPVTLLPFTAIDDEQYSTYVRVRS